MDGGNSVSAIIIDDDLQTRHLLSSLFRDHDLPIAGFASAEDFLNDPRFPFSAALCIVSEIQLPGLDGLSLQVRMEQEGTPIPFVFISLECDLQTCVRAMQHGAANVLQKPLDPAQTWAALEGAMAQAARARSAHAAKQNWASRLATLTAREREVLSFVIAGHLNKQTAAELGVTEKTVKVHRARCMQKLGVTTVAELVAKMARGDAILGVV